MAAERKVKDLEDDNYFYIETYTKERKQSVLLNDDRNHLIKLLKLAGVEKKEYEFVSRREQYLKDIS